MGCAIRSIIIVATLLACALPVTAAPPIDRALLREAAGRYAIQPETSEIAFFVPQMGGGGISGEFEDFDGEFVLDGDDLERSTVTVTIRPGSAATGNARVDAFLHGRAMFDAANHPVTTFRSTCIVATGPRSADVEGRLTARGAAREVRFEARLLSLQDRQAAFEVAAEFPRSLFGMQVGVPIYADRVQLHILITGRQP